MRCPDCNKFVAFDTDQDPEVDLDLDAGNEAITGTVRIVNTCAECSQEMKEYTFDVDEDIASLFDAHAAEHHTELPDGELLPLELDASDATRTERTTGKGRGTKRFYGFEMDATVTCNCAHPHSETVSIHDDVQASSMDEI